MTSLSRHGRCEHCRREFEAELEQRTDASIGYWYTLGAMRIWIELEQSDALHLVCPSCLRRAASEAEHEAALIASGVAVL